MKLTVLQTEAQATATTVVVQPKAPSTGPALLAGEAPRPEDTLYRRYFIAAILTTLTAGATWGAWILLRIGLAGRFTSAGLQDVNAHGQAQIYGWMGLFIMGFAYQAFPRTWHTDLAAPRLAVAAFIAMLAGIVARTVGMPLAGAWSGGLPLAVLGGALELAAAVIFACQIVVTFRRSLARTEPYVGFIFSALAWFVAMTAWDLWHTWATLVAPTPAALVWQVATYQAPLRDMQVHGLALLMIFGVAVRMFPGMFGLAAVPRRRAWAALLALNAAVAGECVLFVAYRRTGNHVLAAFLLLPWLTLAGAAASLVLPWKPWNSWRTQPLSDRSPTDRSAKFVRASFAWLGISLAMLLLLPVYLRVSGLAFSHAYYGAIRHAITVGFVSLMILGVAAKVVPTLNGVDARKLSALWGPFLLVNLGCALRVSSQTLTDAHPSFFHVIGASGMLEVTGLTWWGLGLIRIMRRGKRAARELTAVGATSLPPASVRPEHRVADVVEWFPATLPVFDRYGFIPLRQPLLRRTVARTVSVATAAAVRGVPAAELVEALNGAAVGARRGARAGTAAPSDGL